MSYFFGEEVTQADEYRFDKATVKGVIEGFPENVRFFGRLLRLVR